MKKTDFFVYQGEKQKSEEESFFEAINGIKNLYNALKAEGLSDEFIAIYLATCLKP